MATIQRRKPKSVPSLSDAAAGLTVALVLLPQSLAYAELAGVPPYLGLFAAALPVIAASFLASSPFLANGPTALASLLTLGVASTLATPGTETYVGLVALLALIVGAIRLLIGIFRLGEIAYLMSEPVMIGFTSAAGVLIIASQLPGVLGVPAVGTGIFEGAYAALASPSQWYLPGVLFALLTIAIVRLGARVHVLFPGVLIAMAVAVALSSALGYGGATLGPVPRQLPSVTLEVPWGAFSQLLLGGLVIALVGFAEVASIARTYATEERQRWDPSREFLSQGAANLTSGIFGGFPVGGSFSRSAINRQAGARTRWSGAVTGVLLLAALPLLPLLEPLPRPVLGAIVIGAVLPLVRPRQILALRRLSRPQFAIAAATFVLALMVEPRVDIAVMLGVLLSMAVHLLREVRIDMDGVYGSGTLHLTPRGVLWFGSAAKFEDKVLETLSSHPDTKRLVLHFEGLGRIDLSGAFVIARLLRDARAAGLVVELRDVPPQAKKFERAFWGPPKEEE